MVGRTFLFRDEMKKTADEADRWLGMLAQDVKMLSSVLGDRSFMRASQRLETVRYERLRKGRGKYREVLAKMTEDLIEQESKLFRQKENRLYPTVRAQLKRRVKAAHRVMKCGGAGEVCDASPLRLMRGYLISVREAAAVTVHYLDPSQAERIAEVEDVIVRLERWEKAIHIQEEVAYGDDTVRSLAQEMLSVIDTYRTILAELDGSQKSGTLLAIFPTGFLVWADSVCAFSQRAVKRIVRGKETASTQADEDTVMRVSACLPMTILAEEAEPEQEVGEETVPQASAALEQAEESKTASEERADSPSEVKEEKSTAQVERIYAKASDYKAPIAPKCRKNEPQAIPKMRPLGKHQ